mmetsp:Transcript_28356/g.45952  ORF Transcript_28356/g.45952 Transcript_28356/m.45952 type:complete len:132 (-) Transcript_28356:328-723(-)
MAHRTFVAAPFAFAPSAGVSLLTSSFKGLRVRSFFKADSACSLDGVAKPSEDVMEMRGRRNLKKEKRERNKLNAKKYRKDKRVFRGKVVSVASGVGWNSADPETRMKYNQDFLTQVYSRLPVREGRVGNSE